MPRKNPPTNTDADLNLAQLSELFSDEDKAREFIEKRRWSNGVVCPRCESTQVYKLTPRAGSKNPVPPGVYKCGKCREKFTVRIGTIFEDSKLPLRKWLMAFHLLSSSKKGISSHQIARELGITVKSAWFVTHRIREAMKLEPMAGMLSGAVEVDETYIGGKPRVAGVSKRGRGTKKAPVMVLVERNGRARAKPIQQVDGKTLKGEIAVNVAKEAIILTDENQSYNGVGKNHFGGHETVNHSWKEYSRISESGMNIHTNTAESFFALMKRGHYGVYHRMSRTHLHRYCNEFGFRWDHRKVTDGQRMVAAIKGAEGKRLMYRKPRGSMGDALV